MSILFPTVDSVTKLFPQPTMDALAAEFAGNDGNDSTVPGPSAYAVAVAAGFVGTQAEWLVSLRGADSTEPGPKGDDGTDATVTAEAVASVLPTRLGTTELSATFAARRVHVFACDGQSNMSGRGIPYSTTLDPANARVKQFPGRGGSAGTIVAAAEPLTMHDTASGIGPAFQFARNLLATLPEDDIILLVPNAHGGTMLPTDATPLGWRWGVAGNLSAQAVANTNAALAAAAIAYPNAEIIFEAVLWLEGETAGTNGIAASVYQADLDALIAGYRTAYARPTLPFIMGGMVTEAIAAVSARVGINIVHSDTPYRVPNTGWTPGFAGVQNGDNLHYNAAGQVLVGKGLHDEYQRVKAGLRPKYPTLVVPPVTVPTAGTTVWEDTFNGADEAEVSATDTAGKTWVRELLTSSTARMGTISNAAAPIYTSTGGSAFYTVDGAGSTACQLHAELTVINASFRMVFWYTDISNYMVIVPVSATSVELRRVAAGTSTTLFTFAVASSTSKVIDVVAKSITDVSVWVDGVSVLVSGATPSAVPTAKSGMQVTSTSLVGAGRLDLFRHSLIAA